VRFYISGSELWVEARSTSGANRLGVLIDGSLVNTVVLPKRLQRTRLWVGVGDGEHQAELLHMNETWQGEVTLARIEVRGSVLARPAPRARRLLFLGDSITCGEAVNRVAGSEKDATWWDPLGSYGALVASQLDAELHLVCYGGRGMMRDYRGREDVLNGAGLFELSVPREHTAPHWQHDSYQPHVIVVALGTNDFALSLPEFPVEQAFVAKTQSLLRRIRALHPQALVVVTDGALVNDDNPRRPQKSVLQRYLAAAVSSLRDPKVVTFWATHQAGDAADPHPTREQHAAMAVELTRFLRNRLAW